MWPGRKLSKNCEPKNLIEAYSELAMVCSDVGEIKEAKKYNDRIGLLKKRLKKGDGKKEK